MFKSNTNYFILKHVPVVWFKGRDKHGRRPTPYLIWVDEREVYLGVTFHLIKIVLDSSTLKTDVRQFAVGNESPGFPTY